MSTWLSVVLEIVKLTIPALIVFLTVYQLLKQYLDGQQRMKAIDLKQSQQKTTLPLKLQAYERLSLFCERISIPGLLLRVRKEGMTASQLRIALLMSVQNEYEHNITQQVYVSEQLWQIIKIARDEAVNTISLVAESIDPKADAKELAGALIHFLNQREVTGLDQALLAVKKEAAVILG